jgi:cytochrome P450
VRENDARWCSRIGSLGFRDEMLVGAKDDVAVPKYAYSVSQVETSLPYLRQCVRENFRITPVFTMPLARRVMNPDGVVIGGEHIPQGVSPLSSPLYFPHSSLVTLSLAHDPSPCFTLQFRYFP